jgi:hypothetical protein
MTLRSVGQCQIMETVIDEAVRWGRTQRHTPPVVEYDWGLLENIQQTE